MLKVGAAGSSAEPKISASFLKEETIIQYRGNTAIKLSRISSACFTPAEALRLAFMVVAFIEAS